MDAARFCTDCGARLRKPIHGPWPLRCPKCKRERANALARSRYERDPGHVLSQYRRCMAEMRKDPVRLEQYRARKRAWWRANGRQWRRRRAAS